MTCRLAKGIILSSSCDWRVSCGFWLWARLTEEEVNHLGEEVEHGMGVFLRHGLIHQALRLDSWGGQGHESIIDQPHLIFWLGREDAPHI